MKWSLILFCAVIVTGCVYVPQLTVEQRLEPWKGRPVSSLFDSKKWGYPPDELNQQGDMLIYVYHKRASVSRVGGKGTADRVDGCTVRFLTREEMIVDIKVEGDQTCLDSGDSRTY
ncbi:hypothetical protein WDW89_23115 [Deltaproteobacteria bacterium TL4]